MKNKQNIFLKGKIDFSKYFLTEQAKDELFKTIKIEKEVDRDDSTYKVGNKKYDKTYNFQKFKTIKSFGRYICNGEGTLEDALQEEINFIKEDKKFLKDLKI